MDATKKRESTLSLATQLNRLRLRVLTTFGSLRITVVLFACAIMLILIGTLAQYKLDMWDVIEKYFRSLICWVPLQVFAPDSFFPRQPQAAWYQGLMARTFPFPGGKAIGLGMMLNLGSAYILIFERAIRARLKGKNRISPLQVLAGGTLLSIGGVITWLVVNAGNAASGIQDKPFLADDQLNTLIRWSLACGTLALSGYSAWHFIQWLNGKRAHDHFVVTLEIFGAVLLLCATGASFWFDQDGPSLRIYWQLVQGTVAGVVLLSGFWCLGRRKAGVLLIHFGVSLMMFSEMWVAMYAVEERITLEEGKSANFALDIRSYELAIVDHSPADHDDVDVVPLDRLTTGATVSDKKLPFNIEVVELVGNADIEGLEEGVESPADSGAGLRYYPKPKREAAGADSGGEVDQPAAYIRVFKKGSSLPVSTHLVSTMLSFMDHAEKVTVDGKTYDMFLRFKRTYKPYRLLLRDAVRQNYVGTSMAQHYASEVTIFSDTESRDIRIWMNNPLRYSGETLYQADHRVQKNGIEVSSLQVVTNSGWMIPYVSCMLVFVGMMFHFSSMLLAFLRRRVREIPALTSASNPYSDPVSAATVGGFQDVEIVSSTPQEAITRHPVLDWALPACFAALALCIVMMGVIRAKSEVADDEFDVKGFGELPVMFEGRVKPLDTFARNTLIVISGRQYIVHGGKTREVDSSGEAVKPTDRPEGEWPKKEMKVSAADWLLQVVADPLAANKYRVFRIENLDILDTLELNRRKGFRYCLDEFGPNLGKLDPILKQARLKAQEDEASLNTLERKVLEFDTKIRTYDRLVRAFELPVFTPVKELAKGDAALREIYTQMRTAHEVSEGLLKMQSPLFCPSVDPEATDWSVPMRVASENHFQAIRRFMGQDPEPSNPFPDLMADMFESRSADDTGKFNRSVRAYGAALREHTPTSWDGDKNGWESFINRSGLLNYAGILYVIAFVLTVISWLGLPVPLGRAALATIIVAFAAHTIFLVARIYISGRPPVTNLYSSAVFIGWGGIIFGLVMEALFRRMGIGNAVAAFCGFGSAFIASCLQLTSGDTMAVLVAVLDTQLWLATHVVLVTLGYTATFVSGFLGTIFIVRVLASSKVDKEFRKNMYRMMYGTTCFAIFFSFIGTVLGGLWADDSWGRFWGWDPKENGALIIVLWNTLVLHARWGGMVKDRGFAVLAVVGNICTAWSWFGVNELGIGLHSYGFTEGVLLWLAYYVGIQLVVITGGLLPSRNWANAPSRPSGKSTVV
jgi:ABC-type transport system involved in cytochrome c biogenesis permease subunit